MAKVLVFNDAQKKSLKLRTFRNRKTWLPYRRDKIGGSDAQTLFGEGFAGGTPATLWETKVFNRGNDLDDSAESIRRKRRGVILEQAVADLFVEETGLELWRFKAGEFVVAQHPKLKWASTTLDSLTLNEDLGGWCPVELKQVSHFAGSEWTEDRAPLKVQIQVQMQLLCLDAEWGCAVGWVGGDDVRVRWIQRHKDFQEALLSVCGAFYKNHLKPALDLVEDGKLEEAKQYLPLVTGSKNDDKLLRRLFVENAGEIVRMGFGALNLVRARDELKAHKKMCDARLAWIDNLLKEAFGTAGIAVLPGGRMLQLRTINKEAFEMPAVMFRQLGEVGAKNAESLLIPADAPTRLLQTERQQPLLEVVSDKERKKYFKKNPQCMLCGGRIAKESDCRAHSIEHDGKTAAGLICSRCVAEMQPQQEEMTDDETKA